MNPAANLVLIGPMGAGKSSIGKQLAVRLGLEFVDADRRVEQLAGASVPMIFELEGEAGFRQREESVMTELMQGAGRVVASGGGAILSDAVRALLRSRSFVVYLQLGVEQQLHRLARDRSRPLLAGGDRRQKLQALAAVRNPLYEGLADLAFASDGLGVRPASKRICALVAAQWRREEAA